MKSVSHPHSFLGINQEGQVAIIRTKGNHYGHVVLRGGGGKPNYDSVSVALCEQALEKAGLRKSIMVDCSHANSNKDPAIQPLVLQDITHQILEGNTSIQGLMIESNIHWGNQPIPENLADLKYGVSVTDACIDWPTTEKAILEMRDKLRKVLPRRIQG
jgi:3-deoxy-7-phosphoheptulonate synthase